MRTPRAARKGRASGAASRVVLLTEIVYLIQAGVGRRPGCHSNQVTTTSNGTAYRFTCVNLVCVLHVYKPSTLRFR